MVQAVPVFCLDWCKMFSRTPGRRPLHWRTECLQSELLPSVTWLQASSSVTSPPLLHSYCVIYSGLNAEQCATHRAVMADGKNSRFRHVTRLHLKFLCFALNCKTRTNKNVLFWNAVSSVPLPLIWLVQVTLCRFKRQSLLPSTATRTVGMYITVLFFLSPVMLSYDRLCGLVVRVPGYRSRGPGSIPDTTRFSEK
jgi:hypothetical protein